MARHQRICFVIGTRPEAVKVWPVVAHMLTRPEFEVQVLLTGQHREMLRQAVGLLRLPVTLDLDVMTPDQTLESLTSVLVRELGGAYARLKPDAVIVQGDTTTVFVGALAAFYAGIPVGHLEAGLRTHDIRHPFPEEMNRRLATVLSEWHFAPTARAREALLACGVRDDRIWVTGNTGIDAIRLMRARLDEYPVDPSLAPILDGNTGRIIAVTVHRRENHPFMGGIAVAFARILECHEDVTIVFPVHLAPKVRAAFLPALRHTQRCHLLAPLDYANFVRLMDRCHFVLTDSGGIQEEAPYLGKPVLVMRRVTERPEAVEAGVARLVGEQPDAIVAGCSQLLSDPAVYKSMARPVSPYGDGHAAERVAEVLAAECQMSNGE